MRSQRGLTLVEIVVVLVVVGVVLAVIAPSMILPAEERGLREVLTQSRRAALRRGEALTLAVGGDGKWTLIAERSANGALLLEGVVDDANRPEAEIRISPIGVCTLQRGRIAGALVHLDPLSYSIVESDAGKQ